MKTYSTYAKGDLTMHQCRIADKEIKSGIIEAVNREIVVFHGLEINDIKPARELMGKFGFIVEPEIYEERIYGCFCEEIDVTSEIELRKEEEMHMARIERDGDRVFYIDRDGNRYIIYLLVDFNAKEIDISKPIHYMAAVVGDHPDDGAVCGWFYVEGESDEELLSCCERYVERR